MCVVVTLVWQWIHPGLVDCLVGEGGGGVEQNSNTVNAHRTTPKTLMEKYKIYLAPYRMFSALKNDTLYHRVHREATTAFWRTFHHEGKISPDWWGGGGTPTPFYLHLPSPVKLQLRSSWVCRHTNPFSSLLCKYVLCALYIVPCTERYRLSRIFTSQMGGGGV